MKNQFRLSLRRPAIWAAAWVVVIFLTVARYGEAYVPFALVLGVLIIGGVFWANAGSGIVWSIEGEASGLVVRQSLGGTETIPWQQIAEMAIIHRSDLMGLYPVLRLDLYGGGRAYLPYYLLDDREALKALIISRTRMHLAPVPRATAIERWVRPGNREQD